MTFVCLRPPPRSLLLLALATPGAAFADTVPAVPFATVSSTVTLTSQYVSRGIRQSWGRSAFQAGIDVAHPSGWSVGTWASSIDERFVEGGHVEWDLYGGYTGALGPVGYGVTGLHYRYPGARIGVTGTRYDYTELVPGLSFGPVYAKYARTVSPDFFGIANARGTGYLDMGVNHDLGSGFTLNLHAGDGRVAGQGNAMWNWHDVKAGVAKSFDGGWSLAAAYTRAWGATDAYDRYTTGVPRAGGAIAISNPANGTLAVSLARTL
jgi:uncharacterized protein (TIGR02001 family)